MTSRRLALVGSLLVVALVATVAVAAATPAGTALVIEDAESGETLDRHELAPGEEFSVSYIHSFEKTPVRGVYTVRDGEIFQLREEYAYNAAGLEYTRSSTRVGNRTHAAVNEPVGSFVVRVAASTEHTYTVGGTERAFTDVADPWSSVRVTTEEESYLDRTAVALSAAAADHVRR